MSGDGVVWPDACGQVKAPPDACGQVVKASRGVVPRALHAMLPPMQTPCADHATPLDRLCNPAPPLRIYTRAPPLHHRTSAPLLPCTNSAHLPLCPSAPLHHLYTLPASTPSARRIRELRVAVALVPRGLPGPAPAAARRLASLWPEGSQPQLDVNGKARKGVGIGLSSACSSAVISSIRESASDRAIDNSSCARCCSRCSSPT